MKFFGISVNASSVVFVVHTSGVRDPFSTLKSELTKAVTNLKAGQRFNLLFTGKPSAMRDELSPATPTNKRMAYGFLDLVTTDQPSCLLPVLDAAFHEEPDVIFLFSDAELPEEQSILPKLRQLNGLNRTRICTIAYTPEPGGVPAESLVQLMQQVAKRNGGTAVVRNPDNGF